jgi:hypothetical protein
MLLPIRRRTRRRSPAPHDAPADQQASKPMLAAALILLHVDFVIVLLLAPLPKEMGKE